MMKKTLALAFVLAFSLAVLSGCSKDSTGGGSGGGGTTGGVTLDSMKKAATDKGYKVSAYTASGDEVGGFYVEYVDENNDISVPVIQF